MKSPGVAMRAGPCDFGDERHMPTYEYRCEKGHQFEAFQKMSDAPLAECPDCGAPAERRISSGAGLVFKGTGFYITDYKRAGEKAAAEGSDGATRDSGKSDAAKSDGGKADAPKGEKGSSSSKSGGDAKAAGGSE